MNHPVELTHIHHQQALSDWLADCRTRMSRRYPKIDFDAVIWDPRNEQGEDISKINLAVPLADFKAKDRSFADAIRCLAAEFLLKGTKEVRKALDRFRLLCATPAHTLFELDLAQIRILEKQCLADARVNAAAAEYLQAFLGRLERDLAMLYSKGVLPYINYRVRPETNKELANIWKAHSKMRREEKASILDHQIEATNEAWNALADHDPRLTPSHQDALALLGLELCAPSRINEPLCMSIDDFAKIETYASGGRDLSDPEESEAYSAHQMLIITMKGSKGAQWHPKPVLSFMMQFFQYCIDVIKANGKRSRMLVEWYQRNPDKLYLPSELEHLRGRDLSVAEVFQIMQMDKDANTRGCTSAQRFFASRKQAVKIEQRQGSAGRPIKILPWSEAEAGLLEMVRDAMTGCRRVTNGNFYQGELAKMLFLFDHAQLLPFLPGSFKAGSCGAALKSWDRTGPTVFEVLGITMPVKGTVQMAYIEPHDPRRWLTTMAKIHGSKLSDVLINKWANRLNLAQMWRYDFETPQSKAGKAAMPDAPEFEELSKGSVATRPKEEVCGLQQKFVEVHDIGVSIVSMDAIHNASKNRPRAKTSEDLTVLYANWFGCCSHPHHSRPCQAYAPCLPCSENTVVKGHLPTNDHIRHRRDELHESIVAELKRLVDARRYDIADDQDMADAHIVALVRQGLDSDQMANYLIEHFHELKDQICDVVFRNRLEEAFVATGYVELLDDPEKLSGANLKYNNPSRHAAPGLEVAMNAHGGHEVIQKSIGDFAARHPQFAPQSPEQLRQRLLSFPDAEAGDATTGDGEEMDDE